MSADTATIVLSSIGSLAALTAATVGSWFASKRDEAQIRSRLQLGPVEISFGDAAKVASVAGLSEEEIGEALGENTLSRVATALRASGDRGEPASEAAVELTELAQTYKLLTEYSSRGLNVC